MQIPQIVDVLRTPANTGLSGAIVPEIVDVSSPSTFGSPPSTDDGVFDEDPFLEYGRAPDPHFPPVGGMTAESPRPLPNFICGPIRGLDGSPMRVHSPVLSNAEGKWSS